MLYYNMMLNKQNQASCQLPSLLTADYIPGAFSAYRAVPVPVIRREDQVLFKSEISGGNKQVVC